MCRAIPEEFLWHLFDCLAQGCLILEQGNIHVSNKDPGKDEDLNWRQIVHRDLKPNNST